jgi:Cu2+-exporting ATPase
MSSAHSTAPTPTRSETGETACFHCGLPVPKGLDLRVTISGQDEPMCCYGCQAVARAIIEAGHKDFYRYRTDHADPHLRSPGGAEDLCAP